jgi:hypothetical protein
VYAQLRTAVRRALQRRDVQAEHLEPIALRVTEQAAVTFGDRPPPAI